MTLPTLLNQPAAVTRRRWAGRVLDKVNHILEAGHRIYVSAVVLGAAGGVAVAGYKWFSSPDTYKFIAADATEVTRFILILLVTSWLGLAFLAIRYHTTKRKLREKSRAYDELKPLERRILLQVESAERFNVLAHKHAYCDKSLFDYLFNQIYVEHRDPVQALSSALATINQNIDDLLNYAAEILTRVTGHKCSTNIKVLCDLYTQTHPIRDTHTEDLEVITLRRDSASQVARGHNDHIKYKAGDTTIVDKIFRLQQRCFSHDDLIMLSSSGSYNSKRLDWADDYTALVSVGIPAIQFNATEPCGIFMADNKGGGLSSELCRQYMEQWSWRVSVMLYRLHRVSRALRHLESRVPRTRREGKGEPA